MYTVRVCRNATTVKLAERSDAVRGYGMPLTLLTKVTQIIAFA